MVLVADQGRDHPTVGGDLAGLLAMDVIDRSMVVTLRQEPVTMTAALTVDTGIVALLEGMARALLRPANGPISTLPFPPVISKS